MTDCCTPGTGFPNAALMQQMATNNNVVWSEVCAIQQAILAAASQCQVGGGQMCVTVGGTSPMTYVSGVSTVTVTNPGAGYMQDVPSIRFVSPIGGPGINATGTIVTNGGNVLEVNVTNGGTGYQPIPATLSISSLAGVAAVLQPLVNAAGQIVSINIVNAGNGYTTSDTIIAHRAVAPNAFYIDAVFQIASVGISGEILAVIVTNTGNGYQDSVASVEIVSTLNPLMPYPLGTGFQSNVVTNALGAITQVIITNTGAGYSTMHPYLVISDPGTGATTSVNLVGSSVGSVDVLTAGSNYTQSALGTIFNPSTAPLPNPPTTFATVAINVGTNTFGTNPLLYWQVWSGTATNKQISTQINSVLTYFKGLGYTISIISNPSTGNTIQWRLCW
jgi:hypothetical protein